MLHNRYYEEYESDFQYHLRTTSNFSEVFAREINKSTVEYKRVYITQSGEWYYDEPDCEYILIHVDKRSTISNIDTIARSYMDQFQYPF